MDETQRAQLQDYYTIEQIDIIDSWFDIFHLDPEERQDYVDILEELKTRHNPLLSFNTFMDNVVIADYTTLYDPIIINGQPITVATLLLDVTNENQIYKIHKKIVKDINSGKFVNTTQADDIAINEYYYNEIKKALSGGKKHRKTKKRRTNKRRTNKRRRR